MTAKLRVVPDNAHDDASLSVNISLPTGFEATNTQNVLRGAVLRTTDTTTLVITGVLPANRIANCFFLFRHLLAGANVQLELFTDTGASVAAIGGDSGSNAALCYTASEAYVSSSGTNDPFRSESPYWFYYPAAVTYRSYKLTVSGTPSDQAYYQIGRIYIGRYFEVAINPDFGLQDGGKDLGRSNRTDGGSRRPYAGDYFRVATADLNNIKATEVGTWRQFMRQARTTSDMVMSMFPDDGTSRERDWTWNCAFSSLDAIGHQVNRFTKRIQIEEV